MRSPLWLGEQLRNICVPNVPWYVCRNHNLVLSSFTTYHRVCNKRNTTGATCGAGTAYPSGALESPHPVFSGVRVARSLVFCVLFCRSVFVILFLVIILSVLLRFTASDYLFGIFKLFRRLTCQRILQLETI